MNQMFGFDDHRFHMFTDDMRGGERGRSDGELLPDATHTVIVHFMISPEAMTKNELEKKHSESTDLRQAGHFLPFWLTPILHL